MKVLCVVLAGCAVLGVTGCQKKSDGGTPRMALEPCRVEGRGDDAVCGTYEVYEDRVARRGRKLRLNVMVVKALAPDPAPDPLFVLAGGPGQASTEIASGMMGALERVNRTRDIVFVDQRGTGKSHPLDCETQPPDAGVAEELSETFEVEQFRQCLEGFDADVRLYTTPIAMDDLDEVREALGYEQINLWGGSYGTRAALVYLRQHPQRVRTLTLDGVAPVDMKLPLSFAKDGQRALELLFENCAKDAACSKAFPDLRARFEQLLARLDKGALSVELPHPLTGKVEPARISRDTVTALVRGLLYMPETAALLPLTIDRAASGDYAPLLAQATLLSSGFEKGMSLGMFFSVICAEDAPLVKPEEIPPATEGTFLGRRMTDDLLAVCALWPRGWVPDGYHQPVKSEVPALILSGALDPVTPPARGDEAAKHLPNSTHVVVPGVGHGATPQGCVPRVIAKFIERGTVQDLDTTCARTLQRPPFFISFAGPTR